jgi:parvulin-like peptidyl-prolyl isomerase
MIMKRILLLFLLISLLPVFGFSQADLQPAATVNLIRTEQISVRQLRVEVENNEKTAGRPLTQSERRQVLDVMINERLCLQAAERDRVTITDNEVTQQIQQYRNAMSQQAGRQITDAEFAQAIMSQTGMDTQAFREQLRKQMIVQKYLQYKKGDLINSVREPTEEEIMSEYRLARTQFIRPETVRFSMIQIPYGSDAASRSRARELADRLNREIGSNTSRFDEVAARSAAPNSGYQAGDAGFLPRTQDARNVVGQELMNIAFSLRQGQVSSLIEGVQGYQIIKITENYSEKNLELDDILQLGTRITVREYIIQAMINHRQQVILNQASEELITELRAGRSFQVFENNLNW